MQSLGCCVAENCAAIVAGKVAQVVTPRSERCCGHHLKSWCGPCRHYLQKLCRHTSRLLALRQCNRESNVTALFLLRRVIIKALKYSYDHLRIVSYIKNFPYFTDHRQVAKTAEDRTVRVLWATGGWVPQAEGVQCQTAKYKQ